MDILKIGELIYDKSVELRQKSVLPYYEDDSIFHHYYNRYGRVDEFIYILNDKPQETCYILYCSNFKNDVVIFKYTNGEEKFYYLKISNVSKNESQIIEFVVGILSSGKSTFHQVFESIANSPLSEHIYTDTGYFVENAENNFEYNEPKNVILSKSKNLDVWDVYDYKRNVGIILNDFTLEVAGQLDSFYCFRFYNVLYKVGMKFALNALKNSIRIV